MICLHLPIVLRAHLPAQRTEASCTSAIEAARDVVADIGQAAARSGGLQHLAKCSLKNPERDAHQLLTKKLSLSIPVPISYLDTKDGGQVPLLKLSDWFQIFLGPLVLSYTDWTSPPE